MKFFDSNLTFEGVTWAMGHRAAIYRVLWLGYQGLGSAIRA